MAIPRKPNSWPLKGKIPNTVEAELSPIKEVSTTDPQDAQPTPNRLVATPRRDTPISR